MFFDSVGVLCTLLYLYTIILFAYLGSILEHKRGIKEKEYVAGIKVVEKEQTSSCRVHERGSGEGAWEGEGWERGGVEPFREGVERGRGRERGWREGVKGEGG